MRALGRALLAAVLLLFGRRRRSEPTPPEEISPRVETAAGTHRAEERRIVEEQPASPLGERAVVVLLLAATISAIAFVVVYALDSLDHQTQLLGLSLGLAFAFLAAAALVASRYLVPVEEVSEPYPGVHQGERASIEQIVREGGSRLTRRRLLLVASTGAATALGAALLAPIVSLGPALDTGRLRRSPWRRGVRLIDSTGRPLMADEIVADTFYSAFPDGADPDALASPLVVVRLEPAQLRLPAGRRGWAPDGIVAYSKICTHAGCAVALYRVPHFEPTSERPALVCPCHYSTFDPATGGDVLFGPAGRPLPQLPVEVMADGTLAAAGEFSGAVGPSWWGVRR